MKLIFVFSLLLLLVIPFFPIATGQNENQFTIKNTEYYHVFRVNKLTEELIIYLTFETGNLDLAVLDKGYHEVIEYSLFSSYPLIDNARLIEISASSSDSYRLEKITLGTRDFEELFIVVFSNSNFNAIEPEAVNYELYVNTEIEKLEKLSIQNSLNFIRHLTISENGDDNWDNSEYHFIDFTIGVGDTLDIYIEGVPQGFVYAILTDTREKRPSRIDQAFLNYSSFLINTTNLDESLLSANFMKYGDESVYLNYKNRGDSPVRAILFLFSLSVFVYSTVFSIYTNITNPVGLGQLAVIVLFLMIIISSFYYIHKSRKQRAEREKNTFENVYEYKKQQEQIQPIYNIPEQSKKEIPKFCENCGYDLSLNASFCGNCGDKVRSS
jgi:hypothetical protein